MTVFTELRFRARWLFRGRRESSLPHRENSGKNFSVARLRRKTTGNHRLGSTTAGKIEGVAGKRQGNSKIFGSLLGSATIAYVTIYQLIISHRPVI
jgi:hypothetical protein